MSKHETPDRAAKFSGKRQQCCSGTWHDGYVEIEVDSDASDQGVDGIMQGLALMFEVTRVVLIY